MRGRTLAITLCAIALTTVEEAWAKAVPTGYEIEEGNWGGGSYNREDGLFAFCFVGTQTKSGNRIGVFLLSDATLWLTVKNDGWRLSAEERYPASVEADNTRRQVDGEVEAGAITFDLHQDPAFFNALRNGEELRFVGASGTVGITLRPDTFGAMTALERCLAEHTGLNLQGRAVSGGAQSGIPSGGSTATTLAPTTGEKTSSQNPFASSAPSPAPAPSTGASAGLAEVSGELRGLLMQAGYPSPQMVDLRGGEGDFVLGWTSASTNLHGFMAVGELQVGDYREELDAETRTLRADCGASGQTIFDPQIETYEGRPVYSGRVDCGDDAFAIYFVVVVMDESVLKFYHVADRDSMAMGQQVNANLRARLRER
jgi:hypothetical protein